MDRSSSSSSSLPLSSAGAQAKELARRIRNAEHTVTRLTADPNLLIDDEVDELEAQQSKFIVPGGSDDGSDDSDDDDDSDDGSVDAVEEKFRALEEDGELHSTSLPLSLRP